MNALTTKPCRRALARTSYKTLPPSLGKNVKRHNSVELVSYVQGRMFAEAVLNNEFECPVVVVVADAVASAKVVMNPDPLSEKKRAEIKAKRKLDLGKLFRAVVKHADLCLMTAVASAKVVMNPDPLSEKKRAEIKAKRKLDLGKLFRAVVKHADLCLMTLDAADGYNENRKYFTHVQTNTVYIFDAKHHVIFVRDKWRERLDHSGWDPVQYEYNENRKYFTHVQTNTVYIFDAKHHVIFVRDKWRERLDHSGWDPVQYEHTTEERAGYILDQLVTGKSSIKCKRTNPVATRRRQMQAYQPCGNQTATALPHTQETTPSLRQMAQTRRHVPSCPQVHPSSGEHQTLENESQSILGKEEREYQAPTPKTI